MTHRKTTLKKDFPNLSAAEKRVIDKAVNKTLKDYKKTLDMLAKT